MGSSFESLIATEGGDGTEATQAPAALGRYRILRQIGSGAMGTVYAAHDPSLDREIAIKLLHSSEGARARRRTARLLREAQAMARVEHPNVVEVLDVGCEDGRVFIAMELLPGDTLTEWERASRSWRDVLEMYGAIGRALGTIHGSGLLHRDFKPDNVLIARNGQPKVTDFGLARAVASGDQQTDSGPSPSQESASRSPDLTATGAALGTPRYMPPEQLLGDALDARSDQFAFCVSLYHALYGRFPFTAETIPHLIAAVTNGEKVAIPRSSVPNAVGRVVAQGLSRYPEDRFEDMDALVSQLDAARRRSGRSRTLAVAVGGAAALLAWFANPTANPESPPDPVATEAELRIDASIASLCDASWPEHPPALLHVGEDVALVGTYERAWSEDRREWSEARRPICDPATAHERALPEQHCLEATLESTLVRFDVFTTTTEAEARSLRRALASLPRAIRCREAKLARPDLIRTDPDARRVTRLTTEASAALALGRIDTAKRTIDEAADLLQSLDAPRLRAHLHFVSGKIAQASRDYDGALEHFGETQRLSEMATDWETAFRAILQRMFALAATKSQPAAALALVDDARAHLDRLDNPRRLETILELRWGATLDTAGRYGDALEHYRAALSLSGDDPKMEANALSRIGSAHLSQGNVQEGLAHLREAATLMREHPNESRRASLLVNLANAESEAGHLDDALEHAKEARVLFGEQFGPRSRDVAYADNTLGMIYIKLGRAKEATRHLERSVELGYAAGDVLIATASSYNAAELALERGELEHAEALARRALVEYESNNVGHRPELIGKLRMALGLVAARRGDLAEARHQLRLTTQTCDAAEVDRCRELTADLRRAIERRSPRKSR